MDIALIIEWVVKSLFLILFLTGGFAYTTLFERKVLARMQVRIGPNRAGPFGALQPVADGIKLIFKEDLIPHSADKITFVLAPVITVIPALIITGVVPWGPTVVIFGREVPLYLTDLNVAVLYLLAVTSVSVYGITLAGWSSNNKYATLGGLRATAQMISYELPMGFAILGPVLVAGSLSMVDIVEAQWPLPYALIQPVAFAIYVMASVAEINRAPFDMPEAEQELTAGYHTEYSGMKFALFFMAEYIKMIAVAMIGVTLFLGGYQGPFLDQFPFLGPIYFLLKTGIWLFFIIWLRATLPRIRYDHLMMLSWKVLFPLALLNLVITAAVIIWVGG
ncbi:MAG TPA: NADH-quinone oxidoreductase subunit NuoH [Levilinea sp.]|nr:NADH-quinone oxidoreductase subunit NuoH [Levilinea sp.]